jgi:NADP-dependent 3-hydroxy acid dehydrogenase YdfG
MLKPEVALITGGGTGIGKAVALALAQNGANVAIVSRNLSHLEQAGNDLKKLGHSVLPLQMDVCNKSEVQRAIVAIVSRWGAVYILVNNAGRSGLSMMN